MSTEIVSEAPAAYGVMKHISDTLEPWRTQTHWTEEEYLALETNRLVEFIDGKLEELPMPDYIHQTIADLFKDALKTHESFKAGGRVVGAPFRLNLPNGNYREPDVLYLKKEHLRMFGNAAWTGADLVLEIISPGGKKRDTVDKRLDYAKAGISEYWIIDPEPRTITVLKLVGTQYIEHGNFTLGQVATSVLLPGFSVDVTAVFEAK